MDREVVRPVLVVSAAREARVPDGNACAGIELGPSGVKSSRQSRGPRIRFATCRVVVLGIVLASHAAAGAADTVDRAIGRVVDAAAHPYLCPPEFADRAPDVRRLYDKIGGEPLWVHDGRPTPQAAEAIAVLSDADTHGLPPADYDPDRLRGEAERLARDKRAPAQQVALFDTALTVTLMRYASDAYAGRISPATLGFVLDPEPKALDLPAFVEGLARSSDVAGRLAALDPAVPTFGGLRKALAQIRAVAARRDLPELPAELPTLRPGDRNPAVLAVRRWLTAFGDLPAAVEPADAFVYDRDVTNAVRRFELRHARDADGVLGRVVLHDLRVPLATRIEQIEFAMERLRWLLAPGAGRALIVNIPEFRLRAFAGDDPTPRLFMKAVVGSVAGRTPTPVVHGHMRWVVFRPYWEVPSSIARKELFPRAARDPEFLAREHLEVLDGRLRQQPGPDNALGLVKFVFPNPFDVYLHDTPQKQYFTRARRDFSHGCMRVADAVALAEFVLGWDRERILAAMTEGANNRWVDVPENVDVYVLYTTATVENDLVLFFEDIYGRDAALARALENRYIQRTAGCIGRAGDMGDPGGGGARLCRAVPGLGAVPASPLPGGLR